MKPNKIKKKIVWWLLNEFSTNLANQQVEQDEKLINLEVRLGSKANLDDLWKTNEVVKAILDYLKVEITHTEVEDLEYPRPIPKMKKVMKLKKL